MHFQVRSFVALGTNGPRPRKISRLILKGLCFGERKVVRGFIFSTQHNPTHRKVKTLNPKTNPTHNP